MSKKKDPVIKRFLIKSLTAFMEFFLYSVVFMIVENATVDVAYKAAFMIVFFTRVIFPILTLKKGE